MHYIKDIQAHEIVGFFEKDLTKIRKIEYVPVYTDLMITNLVAPTFGSCVETLLSYQSR